MPQDLEVSISYRLPEAIMNGLVAGEGFEPSTFGLGVPVIGYVVHNKARVALERALRNPRKRVMGVDWESNLTFGFTPQGTGVGAF